MISPGVLSNERIDGESAYPMLARMMENRANEITAVLMLSFILLYWCAPNSRLVTTVAPDPPPIAAAMKTDVSADEAPTAARAPSPTKRPTITESAIV